MKRTIALIIMVIIAASARTAFAAASSVFATDSGYDFYDSTLYEDIYGSEYNYGGSNVTDFDDTSQLPGLISLTPGTVPTETGSVYYGISLSDVPPGGQVNSGTAFTPINELINPDGSIGKLSIPSLSIGMNVYEGTTAQSMSQGAGHFPETSGWLGNVGVCGHNRNAEHTIGTIKDLKTGDIIKYTTVYGTKAYSVSFVGKISSTDWSYLAPTSDNRITLITCLANQPTIRVCVQAVEKN